MIDPSQTKHDGDVTTLHHSWKSDETFQLGKYKLCFKLVLTHQWLCHMEKINILSVVFLTTYAETEMNMIG